MSQSFISVGNISKQYRSGNSKPALDDISFGVNKGELYGIVGPDGAGKTTLLRILATVLPATSGHASIGDLDIRKDSGKLYSRIGYMPQNFSLYPDLSVIENLNFFAELNKVPKAERNDRISSMLDFTRLDRFQKRLARNLSGGMKKKLALSCAMIHSPQVLLLDEPSTGVDPVSRRDLWLILAGIVQNGITIIVSTPYMDEADRCNNVGVLHNGRLLLEGSPKSLKSKLPYNFLEIKARPRKKMREVISSMESIQDWRPVGDRIRVALPSDERMSRKIEGSIRKALNKKNVDVLIFRRTQKSMEDVFIHLVADGHK